jgi:UPF0755 protein
VTVATDPELASAPEPVPGARRPRRWVRVAGAVLAVVLVVVVLAGVWVDRQINPSGPPGRAVDLTIPPGSSTRAISDELARAGVISHPLFFLLYLKVHGVSPLRSGTYALHRHDSYGAAVRALEGSVVMNRLTIPEGFTLDQIADRVGALPGHSAAHFLAVAAGGAVRSPYQPAGSASLEGLLFPDTYLVAPGESDTAILTQMVERFDQVAATAGLTAGARARGLTPYEVVTVASMVEREAKVPADRPLVAEVVYNRLARGMDLQIDATVLYALGPGRTSLTNTDLAVNSPYNTYLHPGLPPGPIADPGLASLRAALHPAVGPYLYYVVVQSNGREAFSTTLSGQEQNIALARSRGLAG